MRIDAWEPEALLDSPLFHALTVPYVRGSSATDGDHLVLNSGLIANVEGWHHDQNHYIGEIIYLPDRNGDRNIFGLPYTKFTSPSNGRITPYEQRLQLLTDMGFPALSAARYVSYLRHKQLIAAADVIAHLPSRNSLPVLARACPPVQYERLEGRIASIKEVLGSRLASQFEFGTTGSTRMGRLESVHDWDIYLTANLTSVQEAMHLLQRVSMLHPKQRVKESGKGWRLRYYDAEGELVCCFFGYDQPADAPPIPRTHESSRPPIKLLGNVVDDLHAAYTPSILTVEVSESAINQDIRSGDLVRTIIYHTASRGEFMQGDAIAINGYAVPSDVAKPIVADVLVTSRDGAKLAAPPWDDFYFDHKTEF